MADGNNHPNQALSLPTARRRTMRAGSPLRAISSPLTASPAKISTLPTHRQILAVQAGALRDSLRKMQAGLGADSPQAPRRRRRSERVLNVTTLIEVLLRMTCIKTGRIGRPKAFGVQPGEPAGWRNPTVAELGRWAFGELVQFERAEDRTWRALRQLIEAGFLKVDKTPPVVEKGGFQGRASVKKWTAAGLKWLGIKLRKGKQGQGRWRALANATKAKAGAGAGQPIQAVQAAAQALQGLQAGQGKAPTPVPALGKEPPPPPPPKPRSGEVTEDGLLWLERISGYLNGF